MRGVTEHKDLSPTDREYVAQIECWLTQKGVSLECAACKASSWTAMRLLAAPMTDLSQTLYHAGDSLTAHLLVPLVCNICGYVVFFNALVMGLNLSTVIVADEDARPS